MASSQLLLQNGMQFSGRAPLPGLFPCSGEVVFTTGMVGYVESLTDPSFCGQILVFTYPLIGNYGIDPLADWESQKIQAAGTIVNQASDAFVAWCDTQGIPLLTEVDTRALTKVLRTEGSLLGCLGSDRFVDPNEEDLVARVSPSERSHYPKPGRPRLVVMDCGMKRNILRHLQQLDLDLMVVPHNDDFTAEEFDAVFVSNGPGDPQRCQATIDILKKVMAMNKPLSGICLGMQLIALAAGANTTKLRFGHRGQNQPCRERATGHCFVTSQNHGYAVTDLPSDWEITFEHLNDGTIAGIAHRSAPFWGVQFHPEAAPGPLDTAQLFARVA